MIKKIFFLSCWLIGLAATVTPGREVPALEYDSKSSNKVFYLRQDGEFEEVSEQGLYFFKRAVEQASRENARAVILELDTPGGSVETAIKYLTIMERATVPVIVYCNSNGISAGMIIALGANRIAISPNGLIGDAMPMEVAPGGARPVVVPPSEQPTEPMPETEKTSSENSLDELKKLFSSRGGSTEQQKLADQKFLSLFFKLLDVNARKNQRPERVIRAMADPYTKLTAEQDGIEHNTQSPLTLSAEEAHRLGVVDYIAENRTDLLNQLGLGNALVEEIEATSIEEIGWFLATPAIAGLLLVLGLLGIFVEIKTPGFGVPGVLGITALTLFFLGHIASGSSSWGPMVVFFVGLILLAIEIFVIPGVGLVGVLGVGCVLLSFFWAFGWENIHSALQVVTTSLVVAVTIMILLAVYVLPKTRLFRKFSLDTAMTAQEGYAAQTADENLIGACGVTLTKMRPAGTVRIGSKRYDAASEGDFMEADEEIEVVACHGFQLIVRRKNV